MNYSPEELSLLEALFGVSAEPNPLVESMVDSIFETLNIEDESADEKNQLASTVEFMINFIAERATVFCEEKATYTAEEVRESIRCLAKREII